MNIAGQKSFDSHLINSGGICPMHRGLVKPADDRQEKALTETKKSLTLSNEEREANVRAWIARKESVCPYAPGLARFIFLPEISDLSMEHVYYLANELKAFYADKVDNERVGRWMIMPHQEWTTHEEAHDYSERIFWLLNAAYFHLNGDKKSLSLALERKLPGFDRGLKGDILSPIIGKLPNPKSKHVPSKSLFYSALSPLYRNKKFYRYCPHSVIPLVYASEFQEVKEKYPKVTKSVCAQMAVSGINESLGLALRFEEKALKEELPMWGSIVDRTAEIIRAEQMSNTQGHEQCSFSQEVKGCPASNLSYFRLCDPRVVNAFFVQYHQELPVLKSLIAQTSVSPKEVISSAFAGSGLYVIPDYPKVKMRVQL